MAEESIQYFKGVGPAIAKQLSTIGIKTITDLLDYLPRTHNDYSQITPISHISPGVVTLKAQFKQVKGRYVRRGMHITEAVASDATGSVRIIWFNQPYRAGSIKTNEDYYITGKLELKRQRFAIANPTVELTSDIPVHTARIIPIYKESKGITSQLLRKLMIQAVDSTDQLPEVLPTWLIKNYKLLNYGESVRELHFPSSAEKLKLAKRTFALTEVFELMLASQLNKQLIASEIAPAISFNEGLAQSFISVLPFKLTDAQRKAVWQILTDMQKTTPMNRLLEGDVGSGKTVVAAMAAVMTMQAGYQVALLAPTELLARQHADTITELLKPLGLDTGVSLLIGSHKKQQKNEAHEQLQKGTIKFIIGTHALLQEKIKLKNLGLLIVDEQHRFGVDQRKELLKQNSKMAHVLSMTATPIPRSLALTLYGELDISLLDEMPAGRKPIKTKIISPNSRESMDMHIKEESNKNHQIYIVCPIITEGLVNTVNAEEMYKQLVSKFKNLSVGLLHGKLKSVEKSYIMEKFVAGKLNILVATTVIEVGVNVPNATIMIIEGADRFGLAQMHQLRGRVGRSTDQGYCYIVPSDSKAPSQRLRALTQSTNGFELAELDLEIRGPGAIYGSLQHGILDLRFAQLSDHKLIIDSRRAVIEFINRKEKLSSYPVLMRRVRMAQAVVTLN
ncbi:ATP-dependent DNA helicase RecG [Candidatus Saccharibacteria bacterium]|nr:ATP-dependent DNA helicase RecG [Candidatus Saccharibacteria bacterium]